MNYFSLFLALLLPFTGISQTQFLSFQKHKTKVFQQENCIHMVLTFEVKKGYHIQANRTLTDNLIPSELILEQEGETILAEIVFPSPHSLTLGKEDEWLVFDGSFEVLVQFEELSTPVKGIFSYQACDDRKCFFPRELMFEI